MNGDVRLAHVRLDFGALSSNAEPVLILLKGETARFLLERIVGSLLQSW